MGLLKEVLAHSAIPLVRAVIRYGPNSFRKPLWNHLCVGRLAWRSHKFCVRTAVGSFAGESCDLPSMHVYYFGQWEPAVSEIIRQRLEPGRTFVDIGANAGWYTLLAANHVGPNGKVVAIEASHSNYQKLERNVRQNQLTNVRLVNEAVWCNEAVLPMYQGPELNTGVSTLVGSHAVSRGCVQAGTVRARPLPAILNAEEVKTLRLLKIDVEGAEREVLIGIHPLIDALPGDCEFVLELTPAYYDVEDVLAPFRERGFRAFIIPNRYDVDMYDSNRERRNTQLELRELTDAPEHQVDILLTRVQPLQE